MGGRRGRWWIIRNGIGADGGVIVRGKQGVFVAIVVFVNVGKIPVHVFFWVAPTLYDAGATGVLADVLVFGESDAEACIA